MSIRYASTQIRKYACDCVQSTINIVLDRVGRVDPVTRGIEISVNYLGFDFDVCPIAPLLRTDLNVLSMQVCGCKSAALYCFSYS